MKKFLSFTFFIILTIISFSMEENTATFPTISLQGVGNIKLEPDRADIQFQVVTEGKDLNSISQENRKIMSQVDKTISDLKISKNNVRTTEYYINKIPQMMNNTTIYTYEVRNGFLITVDNLSRIGDIVAAFEKAGVNGVNSISFYSSKESEKLSDAMVLAYKDALSKGLAVATSAGYSKLSPKEINYDYFPPRRNLPYNMDTALMKSSIQIYTPQTLDFTVNVRGIFNMER